jgi:glycerol-3-phosphate acyltransferase PlsY
MITTILLIIISYLLGSIPTAFLLGKALKGVDIRKFGSGNVGATNAFRVLGKGIGIAVLFFDTLKGFIACVILPSGSNRGLITGHAWMILLGLIAIIGHNWPIFLKFRGGKGIATTLGVLLGLAFTISALRPVLFICVGVWLVVFSISGFVSLASVSAAVLFPVSVFFIVKSKPVLIFSIIVAFFAIYRHNPNISRLLRKEENRVRLPWLKD